MSRIVSQTTARRVRSAVSAALLGAVALAGAARPVFAQKPDGVAKPRAVLIKNATVMTVSHGTLENASVLIRDGKIAAVGKDVKVPDGADVVDAAGKFVTPGVIDCHSHIAIDGGVNEGSLAVTSMARI